MTLKELLKSKLSGSEIAAVPSSFDLVGNREKAVAIIEVPPKLEKKKQLIAAALMAKHKNVKAVLEKASPRQGVFRTRQLRHIAGEKYTTVMHAESGCRFLLDPRKVYFSPRESTERLRIAEKVRSAETVMVFFAGAGPFAIVIGKKAKPGRIIGIELNPAAAAFFRQNVELNRVKAEIVEGDVKKEARRFYGACDRIVMPLPESGSAFLKYAIRCATDGAIVHYYFFGRHDDIAAEKAAIRAAAAKEKREARFAEVVDVLPYGPGIWKIRIDFRVISR